MKIASIFLLLIGTVWGQQPRMGYQFDPPLGMLPLEVLHPAPDCIVIMKLAPSSFKGFEDISMWDVRLDCPPDKVDKSHGLRQVGPILADKEAGIEIASKEYALPLPYYDYRVDEPIVMPALAESTTEQDKKNCRGIFAENRETEYKDCLTTLRRYHCKDGKRILLHSDNGTLHVCLKMPEVEAVRK